jgi:large repetitive protein
MLQLVRGRRGPRRFVLLLRLLTVCGVLLLGLPLPTAYAAAELPTITGPFADAGAGSALISPSSDTDVVWRVVDTDGLDGTYCWFGQGTAPDPALWAVCDASQAGPADPAVVTTSGLTDGTWTLHAVENDGSSFGPVATASYTVDATAPVVTVTAPTSPSAVESVDWTVSLGEAGSTTCTLTRTAPTPGPVEPVTCSPGTVTTSLAGKVEGSYELSVVAQDTVGNTGVPASATYQLDRVPGAATVTATPTVGTGDTAVFTVSPPATGADGPATLTCALRLGPSTVATPDCTTSPVSVGGLTTDGDYVLTVTATDGSGSSTDSSATYARDNAAPTVTFTAGPSGSGQAGSLDWSWTVVDDHPVAAGSCALYLDGSLVSTTACTSPHTETVTGQGTYSLRVTASDAAGNDSAETTSPATYLRDTVVPVVTTTVDRTSPTKLADVTFGASVDDPSATLECRLERTAPTTALVYDWTTCPTAATTLTVDGSYLFSARATDDGQTGTASRTLVLDRVAPDAPTITRAWSTPTNDASLGWVLSVPTTGDTRTCRFTQDAGTPTAYASCSTSVSFPAGATSGLWVLEVRDVDAADNERVTAAPVVELDLVAPAQPVLTSQPSGSSPEPSVSWGFGFPTGTPADAGTTFECRLSGPSPTDGFDWTACATPFPQVLPSDGAYVLELRARDDAGNLSALPVTTSATYVLDRVAPPTPIVVGPSGTASTTAVQWSFSPAPADSTTDDVTRAVCTRYYEGAPVETVDPCASPLARTLTDDGLHRVDVVLYDAAGNPSTAAASSSYLLDTALPVAPTVSALTGPAPSSTPSIQWTWSTAESLLAPARAECRLLRDGVLLGPDFTAPCALPRTDSGLTDGSYVLEVRVVDAAGNVGATGRNAVGYVIDTGAPAVPTFPGAPTGASTSTSISWTISAEAGATLSCRLVRNDDRSGAFGTCTSPYAVTGLADGSYVLEAFATDAALNAGGVGTSPARVVDNAGPVLAAVAGPSGNGNVRRAEWSWVAPEASTTAECQLRQNGAVLTAWATCTTPHVVVLPAGDATTYALEVRLTDSLGNTGPAQTSPTYSLKTTLPVAPTVTPQASPSNDTTPV